MNVMGQNVVCVVFIPGESVMRVFITNKALSFPTLEVYAGHMAA